MKIFKTMIAALLMLSLVASCKPKCVESETETVVDSTEVVEVVDTAVVAE